MKPRNCSRMQVGSICTITIMTAGLAVSLLEKDLSNIEALRELRVELKHLKDVSV